MLSNGKKKKSRKADIIELLNQCTMKLAWGCAVSSSYLQPKHPSYLLFTFSFSIQFTSSFIRPTIFNARHDLKNEPPRNRVWTELPCYQLSHCLFERNLLVLYFFSCPFLLWTRTCIRVQRVRMNRWNVDSILWDTEVKGRNKFGGMTHWLRIIHPHMAHLQMYSDIWSTYILRNRYPTLFNHCISRSHCFQTNELISPNTPCFSKTPCFVR